MIRSLSKLEDRFEDYDLSELEKPNINKLISSKYNDEIFPPYIPFVGKHYSITLARILIYGTAQNITERFAEEMYKNSSGDKFKLVERLSWDSSFKRKYSEKNVDFNFTNIAIQPFQDGILPALVGIFQNAWAQRGGFEKLNECMHHIAVTNYYKFSLRSTTDLNPDNSERTDDIPNAFYKLNNHLVTEEIKCLNPDCVITFNGKNKINHFKILFPQQFRILTINDPSWIKRGGRGCFDKYNGSWSKLVQEKVPKNAYIRELVDNYCEQIIDKGSSGETWKSKRNSVRDYLLTYYLRWKKLSGNHIKYYTRDSN